MNFGFTLSSHDSDTCMCPMENFIKNPFIHYIYATRKFKFFLHKAFLVRTFAPLCFLLCSLPILLACVSGYFKGRYFTSKQISSSWQATLCPSCFSFVFGDYIMMQLVQLHLHMDTVNTIGFKECIYIQINSSIQF